MLTKYVYYLATLPRGPGKSFVRAAWGFDELYPLRTPRKGPGKAQERPSKERMDGGEVDWLIKLIKLIG